MEIYICNNFLCKIPFGTSIAQVKSLISEITYLNEDEYYLLVNGRKVSSNNELFHNKVNAILKLNGGKGGFGSMLRAIGAQIEKTTNREACRDLSGRRLRDINEEKRLKNWIAAQADREREAEDRRQKKLERLCQQPKHEFKDDAYDKERSDLPERLEDALAQGMKASTSGNKRKSNNDDDKLKKKKRKLWIDDELDGLSDELTDDDSENSSNEDDVKIKETSNETNEDIDKAKEDDHTSMKVTIK